MTHSKAPWRMVIQQDGIIAIYDAMGNVIGEVYNNQDAEIIDAAVHDLFRTQGEMPPKNYIFKEQIS